jgi:hypothetical protein
MSPIDTAPVNEELSCCLENGGREELDFQKLQNYSIASNRMEALADM